MLKSLKLLIAAAAMSLMATSAHAVTFTPSATNPLDFGEVATGDSKTISWNISWILGGGESLIGFFYTLSDTDDYLVVDDTCDPTVGTCSFDFQFTPSTLGQLTLENLVQLNLNISSGSSAAAQHTYSLNTTGEGISPVPLPAAFPLLAGALSLLGLFGWRRKRMAVA